MEAGQFINKAEPLIGRDKANALARGAEINALISLLIDAGITTDAKLQKYLTKEYKLALEFAKRLTKEE